MPIKLQNATQKGGENMEEIKKFSTKQLVEELLCREEVIIMPDTKEEVHFMCAEKGINTSVPASYAMVAIMRSAFPEK